MNYAWHDWKDKANCQDLDTEKFFDDYESDSTGDLRRDIDKICMACPVVRTCFAYGKYFSATGVWGGIYLSDGAMNVENNSHKSEDDWANIYKAILEQNDL